jgi:hypothetical protein
VRFEVPIAIKMIMFWAVTPCGLVDRYQRFGGKYCLHLQGWRWKQRRLVFLTLRSVSASETWVSFYHVTRRNVQEDNNFQTCRSDIVKTHHVCRWFSQSRIVVIVCAIRHVHLCGTSTKTEQNDAVVQGSRMNQQWCSNALCPAYGRRENWLLCNDTYSLVKIIPGRDCQSSDKLRGTSGSLTANFEGHAQGSLDFRGPKPCFELWESMETYVLLCYRHYNRTTTFTSNKVGIMRWPKEFWRKRSQKV